MMEDEKILELLKESGEDVEIPDSLNPEEIQKKFKKKRRHVPWKFGTLAAAAAVFLAFLLLRLPDMQKLDVRKDAESTAKEEELEGAEAEENEPEQTVSKEAASEEDEPEQTESGETAAEEEETPPADTGELSEASGIPRIADYDELYSILFEEKKSDDGFVASIINEAGSVVRGLSSFDGKSAVMSEDAGVEEEYEMAGGTDINGAVDSDMEIYEEDVRTDETAVSVTADEEAVPDSTARAEGEYSGTNTQEATVDEADILKTDGRYIYAMDNEGTIRIVEPDSMTVSGEISVSSPSFFDGAEMYVDDGVLQVISQEEQYVTREGTAALPEYEGDADSDDALLGNTRESAETIRAYYSYPRSCTAVRTYDISDPASPELLGEYFQDGRYLTSRRQGGILYLFTEYCPRTGAGAEDVESFVPRIGEILLPCEDIYLPLAANDMQPGAKNLLVAASVETSRPDCAGDRIAVVGGSDIFYVSEKNIYVASSLWENDAEKTELIRFGYTDGIFTPSCAGRIPGSLNNNFSMSEYEDHLRVVSTVERYERGSFLRTNSLYVLDRDLRITGKIENLAQDEEIRSARFMGDQGYFVTYRNTDPLFSADLSDPENPRILGELKITGFSQYLHFYGKGKLLGLGWETDPDTGQTLGLKCSMFDISDPRNVKEVDRLVLEGALDCDALADYHAILADPEKNIFGFAYGSYRESNFSNTGYYTDEDYYYGVFSYGEEKGFTALKYLRLPVEEGSAWMDYSSFRGIYIGEMFYLVGNQGIRKYDMNREFEEIGRLDW